MKYTASDLSPWEKIRVPFAGVIVLLPVVIARSSIATCESVRSSLRDSFFLVFGTIGTPELVFDTYQKRNRFDNPASSHMVNTTVIKPQSKEAPVLTGSRSILEFPPRISEVPLQKR